jgi:hypothetical protein
LKENLNLGKIKIIINYNGTRRGYKSFTKEKEGDVNR